jgi:hypothetical protein
MNLSGKFYGILLMAICMVVGCASPPPERALGAAVTVPGESAVELQLKQRTREARALRVAGYLTSHPAHSEELRARLTEGGIFKGMTEEQLTVVLGEPWSKRVRSGVAMDREHWVYLADEQQREDHFYFENGLLKTWSLAGRQ